jgi:hypothetical protein
MKRIAYFAVTVAALVTLSSLTARAQQPQQDLNLSNAQVMRLQAMLLSKAAEIRSLNANVQQAQAALSAAVAEGDAVRTATALLSLDAAEKALKNVETADQKNLMSLLNDSQKQVLNQTTTKAIPLSD